MLKDTFGEEIYFDKANTEERKCPDGQARSKINPKKTCKENFELILDDGEVKMKRSYNETLLDPSEYCLLQYNGTDLFHRNARICQKAEAEVETKFS